MGNVKFGFAYGDFEFDMECSQEFIWDVYRVIKEWKPDQETQHMVLDAITQLLNRFLEGLQKAEAAKSDVTGQMASLKGVVKPWFQGFASKKR